MRAISPEKRRWVKSLLDFGISKTKVRRIAHIGWETIYKVERGIGADPSPDEILQLKREIQLSWDQKTRNRRRGGRRLSVAGNT